MPIRREEKHLLIINLKSQNMNKKTFVLIHVQIYNNFKKTKTDGLHFLGGIKVGN